MAQVQLVRVLIFALFTIGVLSVPGRAEQGSQIAYSEPSQAPNVVVATGMLKSLSSGKCLSIGAGATWNGAVAIQYTCAGYPDQQVEVVVAGGGWNYIRFVHSGKCLTVHGGATYDGAILDQWDCVGQSNQKWAGGFSAVVATHQSQLNPTKCLTVRGASSANGALVDQWTCVGQSNQGWQLVSGTDNCHPSYQGGRDRDRDGCIQKGLGDYDCWPGSGNGPNYAVGPVQVVDPDEFGLDGDHDGVGCER